MNFVLWRVSGLHHQDDSNALAFQYFAICQHNSNSIWKLVLICIFVLSGQNWSRWLFVAFEAVNALLKEMDLVDAEPTRSPTNPEVVITFSQVIYWN